MRLLVIALGAALWIVVKVGAVAALATTAPQAAGLKRAAPVDREHGDGGVDASNLVLENWPRSFQRGGDTVGDEATHMGGCILPGISPAERSTATVTSLANRGMLIQRSARSG